MAEAKAAFDRAKATATIVAGDVKPEKRKPTSAQVLTATADAVHGNGVYRGGTMSVAQAVNELSFCIQTIYNLMNAGRLEWTDTQVFAGGSSGATALKRSSVANVDQRRAISR